MKAKTFEEKLGSREHCLINIGDINEEMTIKMEHFHDKFFMELENYGTDNSDRTADNFLNIINTKLKYFNSNSEIKAHPSTALTFSVLNAFS